MTENVQGDGAEQAPEAIELPKGPAIINGVEVPEGFNPAWPMMDAASVRAHFDPSVPAAKKPPLTWARPVANEDEWKARIADWHKEAEETVEAAMAVMVDGDWPTLDDCIPPGSLLELIDQTFLATTDIPRELPVAAAIHYLSALLLQRDVVIAVVGEEWRPDVWTICMAESGSGKSFASSRIGKALGGVVDLFPDSSSAAKFVEDLRDHNHGLWMRDDLTCLSC